MLKVITETKPEIFEQKANELLNVGFKLSSSNCSHSLVGEDTYDDLYQGIFIKGEYYGVIESTC